MSVTQKETYALFKLMKTLTESQRVLDSFENIIGRTRFIQFD